MKRDTFPAIAALCASLAVTTPTVANPGPTQDPRTLEVHVVTQEGRDLEGARISIWEQKDASHPLARGTSDAKGRVRLAWSEGADDVLLSVAHPGHPRTLRAMPANALRALEVVLEPGRTRPLRVVDAHAGTLVPFFRTVVLPADGLTEERAFLADGLFVREHTQEPGEMGMVGGLGKEPAMLLVLSERHAPRVVPLDARGGGAEESEVLVQLDDAACLALTITSEKTEAPIADARLAGSHEMLEGPLEGLGLWSSSNAAGRVLYCPPPGTGELHLRHHSHAPGRVMLRDLASAPSILMREPAQLVGSVLDADRSPVAAARVTLRSPAGTRRTTTGPAGAFELHGLPRGPVELEVEAPPGQAAQTLSRRLDLSLARRTELALELRSPPGVRVVDDQGAPVSTGTLVTVVGDRALSEAEIDADGHAALPRALESGALVALREGDSLYFERLNRPGQGETTARLRLPSARITGRVLDARGDALEGALVSCAPRRASIRRTHRPGPLWLGSRGESLFARGVASLAASDGKGRFTMRRPTWCTLLEAQPPRVEDDEIPAGRARVTLEADPQDVEIRLQRGYRAHVKVTSLDSGRVTSGRIELRRPASWTPRAEFPIIAGESRVALEGPGPWVLVARVEDHAAAVSSPFVARAGEEVEIAMDVERGAFLVIEPEGAWPSERSARVLDVARRDWSRTVEALPLGEGRLMLGPLPLGVYEVAYGSGSVRAKLRSPGEVVEALRPSP